MDLNKYHKIFQTVAKSSSKNEFKVFMNYTKFICDQYGFNPDSAYTFLKNEETKRYSRSKRSILPRSAFGPSNSAVDQAQDVVKIESELPSTISTEDLCRVCETNKKASYDYGPGVCKDCSSFFSQTFREGNTLVCVNGNNCFGSENFISCQKCRLNKCQATGMRMPNERNQLRMSIPSRLWRINQPVRASKSLPSSCQICKLSLSPVGLHYNVRMCQTCYKWHCGNRRKSVRISQLKCVQTDKSKINDCDNIDGFNIRDCRRCRFQKISSLLK